MADATLTPAGSLHCPNCGAPAGFEATRCAYCRARLATVSCPACLGPLFAGTRYCPTCGAASSRAPADDGRATVCPRCRAAMPHVRIGDVLLAECPDCDGLWLEAEAFEQLCASREARAAFLHRSWPVRDPGAVRRADRVRYRPCPRCRKLMNRINFGRASGIILDVCRGHGTFLDPGEMTRVTTFIEAGGLDLARDRERQALVEEQRRLRALQDGPSARLGRDGQVADARHGALAEFFAALFNK